MVYAIAQVGSRQFEGTTTPTVSGGVQGDVSNLYESYLCYQRLGKDAFAQFEYLFGQELQHKGFYDAAIEAYKQALTHVLQSSGQISMATLAKDALLGLFTCCEAIESPLTFSQFMDATETQTIFSKLREPIAGQDPQAFTTLTQALDFYLGLTDLHKLGTSTRREDIDKRIEIAAKLTGAKDIPVFHNREAIAYAMNSYWLGLAQSGSSSPTSSDFKRGVSAYRRLIKECGKSGNACDPTYQTTLHADLARVFYKQSRILYAELEGDPKKATTAVSGGQPSAAGNTEAGKTYYQLYQEVLKKSVREYDAAISVMEANQVLQQGRAAFSSSFANLYSERATVAYMILKDGLENVRPDLSTSQKTSHFISVLYDNMNKLDALFEKAKAGGTYQRVDASTGQVTLYGLIAWFLNDLIENKTTEVDAESKGALLKIYIFCVQAMNTVDFDQGMELREKIWPFISQKDASGFFLKPVEWMQGGVLKPGADVAKLRQLKTDRDQLEALAAIEWHHPFVEPIAHFDLKEGWDKRSLPLVSVPGKIDGADTIRYDMNTFKGKLDACQSQYTLDSCQVQPEEMPLFEFFLGRHPLFVGKEEANRDNQTLASYYKALQSFSAQYHQYVRLVHEVERVKEICDTHAGDPVRATFYRQKLYEPLLQQLKFYRQSVLETEYKIADLEKMDSEPVPYMPNAASSPDGQGPSRPKRPLAGLSALFGDLVMVDLGMIEAYGNLRKVLESGKAASEAIFKATGLSSED